MLGAMAALGGRKPQETLLAAGVGVVRAPPVQTSIFPSRSTASSWTSMSQKEADRGQALDQTLQQGLVFGIDPVQIFTDEQPRVLLALTQQHSLAGVERVLVALGRIEGAEGAVL